MLIENRQRVQFKEFITCMNDINFAAIYEKIMKIIHHINENNEFDLHSEITYHLDITFCTFSREIISVRGVIREYH